MLVPRRAVTLMLRSILEARAMVALFVAAGVGTWGLHAYPVRPDEVFLALIEVRTPLVFHVLVYGYATLWFTTPFYVASIIASLVTIVVYRRVPAMRSRPLPPYPASREAVHADARAGRIAPSHDAGPRAATDVAHDPTARPLYRCDGAWRGRDRKDVGLHVSVR